jgi:hypothetical protein
MKHEAFLFQDNSSLLKTDDIAMKHVQENSSLLITDDVAMNHEAFIFQENSSLPKTDDIAMFSISIPLSSTTRLSLKMTTMS